MLLNNGVNPPPFKAPTRGRTCFIAQRFYPGFNSITCHRLSQDPDSRHDFVVAAYTILSCKTRFTGNDHLNHSSFLSTIVCDLWITQKNPQLAR
jgi:hypothetical protein